MIIFAIFLYHRNFEIYFCIQEKDESFKQFEWLIKHWENVTFSDGDLDMNKYIIYDLKNRYKK